MSRGYLLNDRDRQRLQGLLSAHERTPRRKLPPLARPYRDPLQPLPESSVGNSNPYETDPNDEACDVCEFIDVGTVDCLGTADSPAVFVIVDLGVLGAGIELTDDGECEWIGDFLEYDCYESGGGSG